MANSNKSNSSHETSNQSKFYGVSGGNPQILAIINEVANKYAWGANVTNLKNFLLEICAVESDFGNARDASTAYGEGLTQFDKGTFNELLKECRAKGWAQYDISNADYRSLRLLPNLQIFLTRYFIYRRIPSAVPATIPERAAQWKKYYNTHLGKGTEEHYIKMANKWHKILGV